MQQKYLKSKVYSSTESCIMKGNQAHLQFPLLNLKFYNVVVCTKLTVIKLQYLNSAFWHKWGFFFSVELIYCFPTASEY